MNKEYFASHDKIKIHIKMDGMWSYYHDKGHQIWLWWAIDHDTGEVVAYWFGSQEHENLDKLIQLSDSLEIGKVYTDGNYAYFKRFSNDILVVTKKNTQIEVVYNDKLLFVDASHFVMGCDFLGYIYGKSRRSIQTYSGRRRYNVLRALDFITKKITTVTNDTYITAVEIEILLTYRLIVLTSVLLSVFGNALRASFVQYIMTNLMNFNVKLIPS